MSAIDREAVLDVLGRECDCARNVLALPPLPQPSEEELAKAIESRQVLLRDVDGGTRIGTVTPTDAAMLARVALAMGVGRREPDYEAAALEYAFRAGLHPLAADTPERSREASRAIVDAALHLDGTGGGIRGHSAPWTREGLNYLIAAHLHEKVGVNFDEAQGIADEISGAILATKGAADTCNVCGWLHSPFDNCRVEVAKEREK